jgi:hypothetical protein
MRFASGTMFNTRAEPSFVAPETPRLFLNSFPYKFGFRLAFNCEVDAVGDLTLMRKRATATGMKIFFLLFTAIAQAQSLDYAKLTNLLEETQPATVSEALLEINKEYPNALDNYMLVTRSMSLQGSEIQAPRAIVFSEDTKFVLTFTGRNDLRGGDRFEVMHFLEDQKKYEFREIKFFGELTPGSETKFEISEPNGVGQRCLHCHGSNPLPIHDSYPFWPDAFGSQAHTSANLMSGLQKAEVEAYSKFVSDKNSNSRYAFLPAVNFEALTAMNVKYSETVAKVVREVARTDLDSLPEIKAKINSVIDRFARAPRSSELNEDAFAELQKLSEYHQTKLVRYARNFGMDKLVLLDELLAQASVQAIDKLALDTGIPRENTLALWTYTQTKSQDLFLLPLLRNELGQDILYFNSWSPVPGRRFIEFNEPSLGPNESGIVKAVSELL